MNRLFNRAQWDKSNNSTSAGSRLILIKMLMIEVYSLMLQIVQATTYILYALSSWILEIKKLMNRLSNISQWDKSNNLTLIEIELVLMKMLMIEVYSLIQMWQNTINLCTKLFIF